MATADYTCPDCGEILYAEHNKPQIAEMLLKRKKKNHKKTCPVRIKRQREHVVETE